MWQRLKRWARALKSDGMTLWFCYRHPRMPLALKLCALFVVGYFLSPIDLIPDFIPVIGYLDELILLPGCIWLILHFVPAPVLTDARAKAAAWAASRSPRPRSVLAATIILLLWGLLLIWLWQYYGAQILAYIGLR
jgi:uncharacterized membrane protein YkvA (DUF1232 family)